MGTQNRRKFWIVSLLVLFSTFSKSSVASVYDLLTDEQKRKIHNGEQIVIFEDVDGEIWPKSRVYQRVEATPEEAMAVISDYGLQQQYVHRVVGSIPYDTADPAVKIIDYKMGLPSVVQAFFSPDYQLKNTIYSLGKDLGYRMDWVLLKAESIRTIVGGSRIEPLPGERASLVYYENFIAPKSHNFVLRSSIVLSAVKRGGGEVLQSMINHVESEKKRNSALFQKELEVFRSIFNNN